ncbi:GIY-YIG nuclease family protein [Tsukamurella ocularis]
MNTQPKPRKLTPEEGRAAGARMAEKWLEEWGRCCWPDCDEPRGRYADDYQLCQTHTMLAMHYGQQYGLDNWLDPATRRKEKRAAQKRDQDGWVYYARVGEAIKIGFSIDVKARVRQYPPGTILLAVEPGSKELERARHKEFGHSRTRGREWFRESLPIKEHIEKLRARYGDCGDMQPHYSRHGAPELKVLPAGVPGRIHH